MNLVLSKYRVRIFVKVHASFRVFEDVVLFKRALRAADEDTMNRIIWLSTMGDGVPYPAHVAGARAVE